MESVENKEAFKPGNQIDRVILGSRESALLQKWVEALNKRADGLVRFTKGDVVNFLLSSHSAKWEAAETAQIARQCYDEARWLGWSLTKVKAARKSGATLNFEDLMKFRGELLGDTCKKVKQPKNKPLNKSEPSTERSNDGKETPLEL